MKLIISFNVSADGRRGIFIREENDHMDYVWLGDQLCPLLHSIEAAATAPPPHSEHEAG